MINTTDDKNNNKVNKENDTSYDKVNIKEIKIITDVEVSNKKNIRKGKGTEGKGVENNKLIEKSKSEDIETALSEDKTSQPEDIETALSEDKTSQPEDIETALSENKTSQPEDIETALSENKTSQPEDIETALSENKAYQAEDIETALSENKASQAEDIETALSENKASQPEDIETTLSENKASQPEDIETALSENKASQKDKVESFIAEIEDNPNIQILEKPFTEYINSDIILPETQYLPNCSDENQCIDDIILKNLEEILPITKKKVRYNIVKKNYDKDKDYIDINLSFKNMEIYYPLPDNKLVNIVLNDQHYKNIYIIEMLMLMLYDTNIKVSYD